MRALYVLFLLVCCCASRQSSGGAELNPTQPSLHQDSHHTLGSRRSDDLAPLLEGVPSSIVDHLGTCQLSFVLDTANVEDSSRGMRELLLQVRGAPPIDTYSRWQEGSLRSAGAQLSERTMTRALAILVQYGFFGDAQTDRDSMSSGLPEVVLTLSVVSESEGRQRWERSLVLDHRDVLLPLWELAFEIHDDPDLEAYAYLADLINQAETIVSGEASQEKSDPF